MRLKDMLEICLVFLESEPQYAYKRYACKKNVVVTSLVVCYTADQPKINTS